MDFPFLKVSLNVIETFAMHSSCAQGLMSDGILLISFRIFWSRSINITFTLVIALPQ